MTKDKSLDRRYLRVCAVYRMIRQHNLSSQEASELANRPIRKCYQKSGWLDATISVWFGGPYKYLKI